MIKNFFKSAVRNLFRNRIYSFINIAGLSLGLTCAMLIILFLKDEVSYDRFHANVNNIYRVVVGRQDDPKVNKGQRMGITGFFQGPKFTAKIPEIRSFVRVKGGYEDIKTGNDIKGQPVVFADSSFFSIFSFPLLHGDPKTVLSQPNSIVLSEDEAKRQFGTVDAVGKIVLLKKNDQFIPHNVTGVAKRCPENSSIRFEILLPFKEPPGVAQQTVNWFSSFLTTYVVLAPQADLKTVETKMQKVYKEDAQATIDMMEKKYNIKDASIYLLQPYIDMHLNKDVTQENISNASNPVFSYILSGIAFFILFIACINFINLTVARSLKRAKEIGIRKVAGSNRKQLIIQFLGESFILCFAAFIFAIALVQIVLPVFNNLSNKALALSYLLDVKLITGYLALFIVTGLLAGFYPAMVLSGYNPVQTLYGRFTLSGKNYLQKGLVVLQFALASFLVTATFIVFSQFNFLTTEKLGYDDSNLVLVNKPGLTRSEARLFKEELVKSPDIKSVAPKDEGYSFNAAKVNGDSEIGYANVTVDETFIPLLNIPVIRGRNFSGAFPSDSSHSVIVNETFVKKAGWKDPIGQQVSFGGDTKYAVIGVVKDYHFQALHKEIVPEIISMRPENEYGMAYIKIKPGSETASLDYIEKTFKNLFPLSSYTYTFKDQENLKNYEAEAKWKQIILFGAILTIFISCIGLFGLSVSSAEKRTKEIGIRKVLGASVSTVISILSVDFLKLVILALIVSIPVAWLAANNWLENYPYRITLSWWMFSIAGLLVTFIALATISFQAIKAAVANPVKSLRTE
jgi:putative ABC transport system permease protein